MISKRISLRNLLTFIIVIMGLLGLSLALTTGEMYRQLALQNQSESLSDLIRLKAFDQIDDLKDKIKNLGLSLQHSTDFRSSFYDRDLPRLEAILNNQFHQYFVTAGILKLYKIYVYDDQYRLVANSTEEHGVEGVPKFICPSLIQKAKRRTGSAILKPMSELCVHGPYSYFAIIVPVGGLRVVGYVVNVVDPIPVMKSIEDSLGMPIRILTRTDEVIYRSGHWPSKENLSSMLLANYPFPTSYGETAFSIQAASDMYLLNRQLKKTKYSVMLIASIVTVFAVILSMMVLRKYTLSPLRELGQKLQMVTNDKSHLAEPLEVKGNTEITSLANSFNQMIGELNDLYSSLHSMAFTDTLTQLANRALFHEELNLLISKSLKSDDSFVLFMMDLDRFKEVNDTLGHQVGDALLKIIAKRLKDAFTGSLGARAVDDVILARLGGDEFAAIISKVKTENYAAKIAKDVLDHMDHPIQIEGHSLDIGVSIGIVLFPKYGKQENVLLQRADIAMYQAKQHHLGYTFYDSSLDNHSINQLTLFTELRRSIQEDALSLYFQPKIDMATHTVCGAEALVRWHHPKRGFLRPDEFIPFAEQTGLIQPLTDWVVINAIKECVLWQKEGHRISVSVNMSAKSFYHKGLEDQVGRLLNQYGLEPQWLTFEITETVVMKDTDRALNILTNLDKHGVKISVDDFGTGYSSLYYLKKLPVDEIKIDQSFVKDMKTDHSDAAIVKSTIDLGHNMGLLVTAEGVEDEQTLALLDSLGCDVAQGFFLGYPMPSSEFRRWLTTMEIKKEFNNSA